MEQKVNMSPEAATNEPASPFTTSHVLSAVRVSDQLTESLIEEALEAGRDSRPGWTPRADGWTPDRIRTFLEALAQCGVVADAARAAGLSVRGAYAFRNSAKGRAFDLAWRSALLLGRKRLADEVMSRALNGCVEVIMRDGEVWGERHRYDNRLTMAVLTRLDELAKPAHQRDEVPRAVAHEFDQFVDIVCDGGGEASDFIRSRCDTHDWMVDEAEILDRAAHYVRGGADLGREGDEDEWQPRTS